jgi:hypothetical protein
VKITLDRKARYVAGEHQTEPTKDITIASAVSRDSIRIAFTVAAPSDLEVLSADVSGAYLNAPAAEKVYTTAGTEFGPDKAGRPASIDNTCFVRAPEFRKSVAGSYGFDAP